MTWSYSCCFFFLLLFLTSLDLLPPPSLLFLVLSPSVVILWARALSLSLSPSLRIPSLSWMLCSALNCQSGVCCSCMNYGNKETFTFFKTEAIKQMGITALRTESNSQCRGRNNRM